MPASPLPRLPITAASCRCPYPKDYDARPSGERPATSITKRRPHTKSATTNGKTAATTTMESPAWLTGAHHFINMHSVPSAAVNTSDLDISLDAKESSIFPTTCKICPGCPRRKEI